MMIVTITEQMTCESYSSEKKSSPYILYNIPVGIDVNVRKFVKCNQNLLNFFSNIKLLAMSTIMIYIMVKMVSKMAGFKKPTICSPSAMISLYLNKASISLRY